MSSKKFVGIGIGVPAIIALALVSMSNTGDTQLTTAPDIVSTQGLEQGNIAPDFSLFDPEKGLISIEQIVDLILYHLQIQLKR